MINCVRGHLRSALRATQLSDVLVKAGHQQPCPPVSELLNDLKLRLILRHCSVHEYPRSSRRHTQKQLPRRLLIVRRKRVKGPFSGDPMASRPRPTFVGSPVSSFLPADPRFLKSILQEREHPFFAGVRECVAPRLADRTRGHHLGRFHDRALQFGASSIR